MLETQCVVAVEILKYQILVIIYDSYETTGVQLNIIYFAKS